MSQVFWSALSVVLYVYAAFPLLLLCRAMLRRTARWPDARPPSITCVIAARNEVDHIGTKLDSILASDYPNELLDVVVASDGSSDGTEDVVSSFGDPRVRLITLPPVGKAAAIRAAVAEASGDVLVFTDAEGVLPPNALRELVRPFADPRVGGVAGDHRYVPDPKADGLGVGERRYRGFDRLLKLAESRGGNVVSAAGALHALRRTLYQPIPPDVTDDAFLSMGVIEQGYRLVFAPRAVAIEPLTRATRSEFARKVRVVSRGLRTVWHRRRLLDPFRYGFYALELFTHKVLRRFVVFALIALMASSVALWPRGGLFFRTAAVAQAGLYALGVFGLLLSATSLGRLAPLALPAFFLTVNAAALVAIWNLIRGKRIESWQPVRTHAGVDLEETSVAPAGMRGWAEGGLVLAGAVCVGSLTGLRPAVFAGLAVTALLGAVVLLRPRLTTLAAIGLIYSNAVGVAVDVHAAPRVLALIIPALLSVKLVHRLLIRREPVAVVSAFPFVVGYLAVQAASAVQAQDKPAAIAQIVTFLIEGLGLYLVLTNVVRSRSMLNTCVRMILVIAAVLSALGIARAATGQYDIQFFGFAQAPQEQVAGTALEEVEAEETLGGFRREAGPIGDPNRFAQFLLPVIPLGLGVASLSRIRFWRYATIGAVWLVLGGLIVTFSRGAFLGLAATVALLLVMRQVKASHVMAGVGFLVLLVIAIPAYRERVLSLVDATGLVSGERSQRADGAIRGRFTEGGAAALAFVDKPILGLGPGNFASSYRQYANEIPERVHRGERRAHNAYLEVAAETGILGILAVFGVFIVTLRELLRARRRAPDEEGKALASKFLIVVFGLMATSVFLHFSYIRYFWMFMALAGAAARIAMRPASGAGSLPAQDRAVELVGRPA